MDYQFLSQTMLFSGESPEEIKEMLSCLGAVTRSYGKGEIITCRRMRTFDGTGALRKCSD